MADSVEIHVLDKRVRLLQPTAGFRTSLDSVMLAAACPARTGERVLDMGCGVGGAAFCVLERVPGCLVSGVDVQADYVALAERNIALNGREGSAGFVHADIRDYAPEHRFDHVVCNPPYLEEGKHTPSPDAGRAAANGGMEVRDWIDAGFRLLKSGGSLTLIHRADALDRIMQALGKRFGAVETIPLWPRGGETAKRMIVRAVKDRKSPATLHAGIVLHNKDGSYTEEAEAVLRGGIGLCSQP